MRLISQQMMMNNTFKKKTRICLQLAGIVASTLTIASYIVAAAALPSKDFQDNAGAPVCNTAVCQRSAYDILQNMNGSVNPCNNFFNFVCGNWPKRHSSPNRFRVMLDYLNRKLTTLLERKPTMDEPQAVQNAKAFYQFCKTIDELNPNRTELHRLLRKIGLPNITTVLSKRNREMRSSDEEMSDWTYIIVNAKRLLNLDLLIEISSYYSSDYGQMLLIDKPDVDYTLNETINESDAQEFIRNETVAHYLGNKADFIEDILDQTKDFNLKYNKIILEKPDLSCITTLTVQELQHVGGQQKVDWVKYFTLMFDGVEGFNLPENLENYTIAADIRYLKELDALISQTEEESVELYMWQAVINALAHYYERFKDENREKVCALLVGELMPEPSNYLLTDAKVFNQTKEQVERMLSGIKSAFKTMIQSLNWMDNETKAANLEKVDAVRDYIGVPEWILNRDDLDFNYKEVNLSGKFLQDIVNLKAHFVKNTLENIGVGNPEQIASPLDINAEYFPEYNSINILPGILHFPFYGHQVQALNYGEIGAILGHELTHGFDNNGRRFDKMGQLRKWWSDMAIDEFKKRTTCFVKEYDDFRFDGFQVDGQQTLGENIADNSGLQASLLAFQNLLKTSPPERSLPGLEKFSPEQLFFISFANNWCSADIGFDKNDVHAPKAVRVIGVLQNSEEFSRIWNCKKGSPMNPNSEKCKVW